MAEPPSTHCRSQTSTRTRRSRTRPSGTSRTWRTRSGISPRGPTRTSPIPLPSCSSCSCWVSSCSGDSSCASPRSSRPNGGDRSTKVRRRPFACAAAVVPASLPQASASSHRNAQLWPISSRSTAPVRPQPQQSPRDRTVKRTRWQTPPGALHKRGRMPVPHSSDDPCHRSCQSPGDTTARQLPATTLGAVCRRRGPDLRGERPVQWASLLGLGT